ncbi:MAG: hypothetical protein IPK26_26860 [Planctomycetes bacterium]|nr:hypothetical protein [Planctomycetota bacterium]
MIHGLGSCGAAAAPAHDEVRAFTLDRELRVRCAALSAIRLLALTDPAFPQVIALSRDGPANVREAAVSAALAIVDRPRVGRAMLRVIEALRDPDDRVVRAAGGALRAFCAR